MIILSSFFQEIVENTDSLVLNDFIFRLLANMLSVFILIRFIYYPNNGQSEYLFTYFMMGLMVFLVSSILDRVKVEFGFALGLFAIFSIIRFRTPPVDMKELTYLFTVLGLSVINALVDFRISDWLGMLIANVIVLGSALFMEKYQPRKNVAKKMLTFTLFELQILNDKMLLNEEIKKQTKLNVFKVEVLKINAPKNEVTVWIFYR
jgi:hypothetical protein